MLQAVYVRLGACVCLYVRVFVCFRCVYVSVCACGCLRVPKRVRFRISVQIFSFVHACLFTYIYFLHPCVSMHE